MDKVTHESARDYWKQLWRHAIEGDGGHCPVCTRWGKLYRRTINRNMALSLRWLHNKSTQRVEQGLDEWFSVPESKTNWVIRRQEVGKMRWWGLTERPAKNDPVLGRVKTKAKQSGLWRCTPEGVAFLKGDITVPECVWVHKDNVEATSSEKVSWEDCIPANFNYAELMSANFNDVIKTYDAENKNKKNTKKYTPVYPGGDNNDLL